MKTTQTLPAPEVRAGPADSAPDSHRVAEPGDEAPAPTAGQSRLVQDVLPWFTSLVVHVALILLGVATATVIMAPPLPPMAEEQINPIDGKLHDSGVNVAELAMGKGPADLSALPGQDVDPNAADGLAKRPGDALDVDAGGGEGEAAEAADRIALGGGVFSSGVGGGLGHGDKTGDGKGNGGPPAMFRTPAVGGGQDGNGIFIQKGPQARRIVYICDATGTMISKLGTLKHELTKSIAGLKPNQAFNVIFFTDGGKYHIADKNGLIIANPDNKRQVYSFLEDIVPTGTTDPLPAIAAAFAQKPDMVYFLSDGEFNNLQPYEAVVAEFERANQDRRSRVNTILFETYDATAEGVMQTISQKHGGLYRYVREADLR